MTIEKVSDQKTENRTRHKIHSHAETKKTNPESAKQRNPGIDHRGQ